MRYITVCILMVAIGVSASVGAGVKEPSPDPDTLKLWPKDVPVPSGLKFYEPTQWAQRTVINNSRDYHHPVHENTDDVYQNSPPVWNPNRMFPWRVSGGLDPKCKECGNRPAIVLPEKGFIRYRKEYIYAGASRPLPKVTWSFPSGTRTYDLLTYRGETFELRLREKVTVNRRGTTQWRSRTIWTNPEKQPPGYKGPGRKCSECHDKAGEWQQYGTLLRGNDTVFSFPALEEGTLTPDKTNWPVKAWDEP